MDNITDWKENFLKSSSDKHKNLLKEFSTDGIPLISQPSNSNDNGVLYLGNHRHTNVTFTIIGIKNGSPIVEEVTTSLPSFYQGLDFGNNQTVIVMLNGKKYVASPFQGLAAIVYW